MWTAIVVFALLTAGHKAQTYDNSPEGPLFTVCPPNHVVSGIKSSRSDTDNDRQWKIECRPFVSEFQCHWTGFHNLYDHELTVNCKANHVMAGVASIYSSEHGDRRWSFFCCSTPKLTTFECQESPAVNYWNEDFDWFVPGDNFLTGARTNGKNEDGDHRWSYKYCRGTLLYNQTVNSQILSANQQTGDSLIEGDVAAPTHRNARNCQNCKWPKSGDEVQVPYTTEGSFSSSDISRITNSMKDFHLNTCIRFIPKTDQSDYLRIIKGSGCWSYVGQTEGAQDLSLGRGCLNKGIIQHELIHALGFFHEQSRTDRDLYVNINLQNILRHQQRNFKKLETNNLNVPYDYSSVMHYGPKAFSRNRKDTITSLGDEIGQRIGMSTNDILKINKLYDCKPYLHKYGVWDNQLRASLYRKCPPGQAVSGIRSFYNRKRKDRTWSFSCKGIEETRTCRWSRFNKEKRPMDFKCGTNEMITGVYSRFPRSQDRQWKFLCCRFPDVVTTDCRRTSLVNYWQEYFNFPVPSDNVLTGVKSSYDNRTGDRRWSFTYCKMGRR